MAEPPNVPPKMTLCVGAVVLHDDRVLFVRQTYGEGLTGVWTLPWGYVQGVTADGQPDPPHAAADPAPIYDRVLMNSPFEHGQGMAHVRRAYNWLKPGGRLISIMSKGAIFRLDRPAREFCAWPEKVGGWSERLPDNSFELSGTGVATRIVVVDR